MQPRPGGQRGSISHYELLDNIGQGGMGVVYRARDTKLDRIVALKFLRVSTLESETGRHRFIHEAQAISRLTHRHIAVIHAIEECEGEVFLVFEYLPGGTLRSRLDEQHSRSEKMPPRMAATYAYQIAEGLSHAHAHGIIHRDIKPSNLMFAGNGDLKIVDFGVSRLRGRTQITHTGAMIGTPMYMSPEQAQGKEIDERTDIFSLGVVLYEMAAGRPPFAGDHAEAIVHQIIHTPVPRIRECDPPVPAELENIIGRALEKNPAARYARMVDFADDLRSFGNRAGFAADAAPTEKLPSRQPARVWRRYVFVAAVLVLAAFSVFLFGRLTKAPRDSRAARLYAEGAAYLYRFYVPGNIDKAIASLGQAVGTEPRFADAFVALSNAYLEKYRDTKDRQFLDQARTNADRALGLDGTSVGARVITGMVLAESGDHEGAIAALRRVLSGDPNNVQAMRELATLYGSASNPAEAETLFATALRTKPSDWNTWSQAGVFHFSHQNYAQAEKDFRTVISLAPDSPAAHRNLGAVAMDQGKLEEAEQECLASIRLAPTLTAYSNLSTLYMYQGRYRDAVGILERAVKQDSSGYRRMHILLANLADAYRFTPGQSARAPATYRRAIEEVEKLLAFAPDDPDLLSYAAVYWAKLGDRSKALDEIGRALSFAHGKRIVSFHAGLVYELTGSRDRALAAIEDAIRGGYSLDEIESDPDLKQLCKDRRFQHMKSVTTKAN